MVAWHELVEGLGRIGRLEEQEEGGGGRENITSMQITFFFKIKQIKKTNPFLKQLKMHYIYFTAGNEDWQML